MNKVEQTSVRLPRSIVGRIKLINMAVLVLIVGLFASFLMSSHSYHNMRLDHQLERSLNDAKGDLDQFQQDLFNKAMLLQHHEVVLDYFLSVNMEVASLAEPLPESLRNHLDIDAFLMYGLDGAYLGGFGKSLLPAFKADREQEGQPFWYSDGKKLYAIAQSSVYYGKDMMGFIVLAKVLQRDDVAVMAKGELTMQLKLGQQVLLQTHITQSDRVADAKLNLDSVMLMADLEAQLTLAGYISASNQQQSYFEWVLLLAMLVCVLLWVWLFQFYVTDGVSRLQALKEEVLNLQLGEVLAAPAQQRDEVDVLGTEFAALTQRLALQTDALDAKRQMLQTILDAAPVAVWMTDCDAKVVFMNRNLAEFLDCKKEGEVDGASQDILPKVFYELSTETLKDDISLHEMLTIDRAEHTSYFDVACAPLHAAKGMVGFAIDRTVRERNKKIMQEMQTRVEHVQRLESLGVLAGGIAHDFNNLLAVIVGASSLAKYNISNEENVKRQLQRINQASDRAAKLCKQMLDYAGLGHYELQALDMSEQLSSMADLLSVTHGEHVHLQLDMAAGLPMVEADEGQIQQVVMNLITNACDACTDDGGQVILATGLLHLDEQDLSHYMASEEAKPGSYVFIKVTDHGCGMNAETKAKVFDPFFSTKFTGRGLGMSAVLGIVRSHGAVLSLQSELAKGTVCMVALPISSRHV